MENRRNKGIAFFLIVSLLMTGTPFSAMGSVRASYVYTNAKEFYESRAGQGDSHVEVLDGDIYFATRGKAAATGGGLRYMAAGFDIRLAGGGSQVELAVKRGGTLTEVPGSAVLDQGYWYNLYRITVSDIYRLAIGKQGAEIVMDSDHVQITMDAIITVRKRNDILGSIEEDGAGNVTEQGEVFHLKEDGEWQAAKGMFPGHTFESYRHIRLSACWKPYIHTVYYQAGEGNVAEKESVRVARRSAVDLTIKAYKEGWEHIGWNTDPTAMEALDLCEMGDEDLVLYAVYRRDISVSYDTGGVGNPFSGEIKPQYHNASGTYQNPQFTLAGEPGREHYAFTGWWDADRNRYEAGKKVVLTKNTTFLAGWDQYPSIVAKDRYFTLRQAVRGEITEEALLERVTATDLEDGILVNGEAVRVQDYRREDYTQCTKDADLPVIYEAVDSCGNRVRTQVMVHIVDTEARESGGIRYVRFISSRFYGDKTGGIAPESGGLLTYSVWNANEAYRMALEEALKKSSLESEVPETAETWTFTREQVKDVKDFVKEHGFGRYLNSEGTEQFYRQFGGCR